MASRILVAALAAVAAAAPGGAAAEQYWGLSWSQGSATLHRVDPVRLTPNGPSLALGSFNAERSFSPDGSTLAVVARDRPVVRFVDLERMRVLGDARLAAAGEVHVLRWTQRGLVAVVDPPHRRARPLRPDRRDPRRLAAQGNGRGADGRARARDRS